MEDSKNPKERKLSAQEQRFFETAPPLRQEDRMIINIWSSADNKSVPGVNVGHAAIETPTRYISLWPGPRQSHGPRSSVKTVAKIQRALDSYFKARPSSWKASYLEDCVSEALSEEHYREIDRLDQCLSHEQAVAISEESGITILNTGVPIPDGAQLLAIAPAHANVRIALYGLNVGKAHAEFDRLQGSVAGWRLVGSNFLSRLTDSTSKENCASLAYRILDSGGMYRGLLKLRGSSENASVTKPDVLIKHAMAAKQKEIEEHVETRAWTFPGESSLTALQKAYGEKSSDTTAATSVIKKEEGGSSICLVM